MSQDTHPLVERVIELVSSGLTRQERTKLRNSLLDDYRPFRLSEILAIAQLISTRQTRLAVEYLERDAHWMMRRYWGDVSTTQSYENNGE